MIEPLQLDYLLVNVFAGRWDIFLYLAMAVIAGMSARFRMSNSGFGVIMLAFCLFVAVFYEWLTVLLILGAGVIIFSLTTRWVNR